MRRKVTDKEYDDITQQIQKLCQKALDKREELEVIKAMETNELDRLIRLKILLEDINVLQKKYMNLLKIVDDYSKEQEEKENGVSMQNN